MKFKCPDCHTGYESEMLSCPCGWISPAIDAASHQASAARYEKEIEDQIDMPAIRDECEKEVEKAKAEYGDGWQAKLIKKITSRLRHEALLDRRAARKKTDEYLKKLEADRIAMGLPPSDKSPWLNEENFMAHVRELEAAGKKVKLIPYRDAE